MRLFIAFFLCRKSTYTQVCNTTTQQQARRIALRFAPHKLLLDNELPRFGEMDQVTGGLATSLTRPPLEPQIFPFSREDGDSVLDVAVARWREHLNLESLFSIRPRLMCLERSCTGLGVMRGRTTEVFI